MFTDAHCHLDNQVALAHLQNKKGIKAIINCQTPQEWRLNQQLVQHKQILSFGIHPWDAARFSITTVLPYLKKAPIIGEIGLDNVWTTTNIQRQLSIFQEQLRFAHQYQKPVILHTKGCEATILKIIRHYPNRYLIHWYDCPNYQVDYINLHCYFTVNIAVMTDPIVAQLAQKVPLDHLLIETDGLESLSWVQKRQFTVSDYPQMLQQTFIKVAQLRKIPINDFINIIQTNFLHFLN